jgi:hypothetical protein
LAYLSQYSAKHNHQSNRFLRKKKNGATLQSYWFINLGPCDSWPLFLWVDNFNWRPWIKWEIKAGH